MRLGRKQQAEVVADQVPRMTEGNGADVTELRTVEQMRVCPACLVVNSAADEFCTGCGARLPIPRVVEGADAPTVVAAVSAPVEAPTVIFPPVSKSAFAPVEVRSRKLRVAFLVAVIVAVLGTGTFAFMWQSEKTHRNRTAAQRDLAQASLASARGKLAKTLATLNATRAIANERKAVLLRAQTVLAKVDPLLSDADGIKQVASQIQVARDTFASDSGQMTSDLIYLENFEANPQDYPGVDQWALVSQVNSELGTVRADYAALTSYDGRFSDASTKFGNHATAFTNAVRQLDAQLRRVAK